MSIVDDIVITGVIIKTLTIVYIMRYNGQLLSIIRP